jgi:hypothetical protein
MTTTSKTRAVVLLGAAFLLGAVAGGFGMTMRDDRDDRRNDRDRCEVRNRSVCFWAEELQLTTEQQESLLTHYREGEVRLDSIHGLIRPQMDSLYQTIRPQVDSHRVTFREGFRPLLTPEQREKYDSATAAMDEQRRQYRERGNGGPAGPGGPPRGRP